MKKEKKKRSSKEQGSTAKVDNSTFKSSVKKQAKTANSTTRKVSSKSRKTYYITGLRYRLSDKSLLILEKLAIGWSQAEIAKSSKNSPLTKKGINYWALKFLRLGFIKVHFDGKPKYYRVTPLGLAIIARSERTSFCMMEDYPSKFELIADHSRIAWTKLGDPKNWVKLGFKVGDVTVEKTSKHIIVHTGQIAGKNEIICAEAAGVIKHGVKAWLQMHGVVMGDFPIEVHKPIFKFYSKEAEILHQHFGNITTEDGTIDNSPPDCIPHEEYERETAINKIGEANRLARMEIQQTEMAKDVKELKSAIRDLTGGIKDLTEVISSTKKPLKPDKTGMVW